MADRDSGTARRNEQHSGARVTPQAVEAEEALLGACLADASARAVLEHELVPEDFWVPRNALIATAILDLTAKGEAVDTVTVTHWLAERNLLESIGGAGTLVVYLADYPTVTGAPSYARLIAEAAVRRKLIAEGSAMVEGGYDTATPIEAVVNAAAAGIKGLDLPTMAQGPDYLGALLDGAESYNWLIPNLLERGDRLIVTGGESAGKSYLLAALAVQMAAGVHPFIRSRFEPVRVLVIDVENPINLVRRRFVDLLRRVPAPVQSSFEGRSAPGFDSDRLRVRVHPEGLDLNTRNDRKWYTERVMVNTPDVVVTGPLYKLYSGKPEDEGPARDIAAYFDDLRATYGVTLIIEAHQPYGSDGAKRIARPIGTSVWSRWPEFGFCLRLADEQPPPTDGRMVADWVSWKVRDVGRDWPKQLISGGHWPWSNKSVSSDEPLPPEPPRPQSWYEKEEF